MEADTRKSDRSSSPAIKDIWASMPWTCCKRRRLIIIKRWTDHEGFHAILKCRWCDWYERKDIPLKVAAGTETIQSNRRTISDMTRKTSTENVDSQPSVADNTEPGDKKADGL